MAITKTYINDSMDALASFLSATGLFDSVTNESNTVTCKDADGNTLLTITTPTATSGNVVVTAYASASVSKEVTLLYYQSGSIGAHFTYAYSCANGAIIALQNAMGNDSQAAILITKTNNDKTAIIFSNAVHAAATSFGTFWAVAWGDVAPLSSFTFTAASRNQTAIVPFMTCNDLNASSYTPNAGYIPVGQYYSMGYGSITMDGVTHLTNGYWAIKDS